MIEMGDKVKDVVTGFSGVVTGIAKYITGCTQMLIVPTKPKDGKPITAQWYDDSRLVKIKRFKRIVLEAGSTKKLVGGPQPDAPTNRD